MTVARSIAFLLTALAFLSLSNHAYADSFGSGANTFDIEFVPIGNPGNVADTTGAPNPAGSVPYSYRIGKYEISEQMIDKANTLGGLGITYVGFGPNKPATRVSWFEAAKFVNWLNIDADSTPAYKFDGGGNFQPWGPGDAGYNPNNLFRNRRAQYFLPSIHEWHKAAYYDPVAGHYWDFPTGSDAVPDGIDFAGDPDFDAVFFDGGFNNYPNDITNVGVLSPYGTAGQGGNVWEWEETGRDRVNDSSLSSRVIRGGDWGSGSSDDFLSSFWYSDDPSFESSAFGFRVASIPEPSTLLLGALASAGVLLRRRG